MHDNRRRSVAYDDRSAEMRDNPRRSVAYDDRSAEMRDNPRRSVAYDDRSAEMHDNRRRSVAYDDRVDGRARARPVTARPVTVPGTREGAMNGFQRPPLLFIAVVLSGCTERAACTATGGDWNDCAVVQRWCVDGAVQTNDQAMPAVCERGCTCPGEAPVWDPEAGCITEADCAVTGGT